MTEANLAQYSQCMRDAKHQLWKLDFLTESFNENGITVRLDLTDLRVRLVALDESVLIEFVSGDFKDIQDHMVIATPQDMAVFTTELVAKIIPGVHDLSVFSALRYARDVPLVDAIMTMSAQQLAAIDANTYDTAGFEKSVSNMSIADYMPIDTPLEMDAELEAAINASTLAQDATGNLQKRRRID